MATHHHRGAWAELLWGRNGLRSLALAGGVAVQAINIYMVTTILPSVVADIGGLAYYAWNATLYVAASILGSSLTPQTMSALGLRRAFQLAILGFSLGTLVCAIAPSMPWLLVGRTIQGYGGGGLLGLSYAAVRVVFEERLWSRAMVLVSSMWGVATLAGPAIGGIFAQTGQWRWAFWAVLPFAAGLSALVATQLQARQGGRGRSVAAPLDRVGLLVVSVMLVSVASLSPHWWWNVLGIIAGVILTIWVAHRDRRAKHRLFPTGSYTLRHPLGSLYACICLLSIGVATEIYIPYFLQVIHDKTPLIAGYWAALMSAGWTTGSFISSGRSRVWVDRYMKWGPIVSAAGLAAMAIMMPLSELRGWGGSAPLVPALLAVGLGVGLCWPNMLTRVFKSAPQGQENIASAAITTLQLYAVALGAALAGMVTNAAGLTDPGGVSGAQQAAFVLFIVFTCSPAAAALLSGPARRAG